MELIKELGRKPPPETRVAQRKFVKTLPYGLFKCPGCGELSDLPLYEGKRNKYCSRKCAIKYG